MLNLNAKANVNTEPLFLIELSYGGIASLNDIPENDKNAFVMIEGPRLLFPFARATIATITREGGFFATKLATH